MLRRYSITVCISVIFLFCVCAACEKNQSVSPAEQPDGTFLWNGFQIIRDDNARYGNGASRYFFASDNVITTKDTTLVISIKNNTGDPREYGMNEFIQVNLDGVWYTFPQRLSQSEPFILEAANHENRNDPGEEFTVDLSVIGGLPAGKYRLIENFYEERLKDDNYVSAYFWVINPGEKRPPESETTGKARNDDIVFYVESLYEARRQITDKDIWFGMFIENLSGKDYYIENDSPVLEIKRNGKWAKIDYKHANVGLMFGWERGVDEFFLYEPLTAGRYRIRLPMHTGEPGNIELKYEFDVIAYEDANSPRWDILRLKPSPYDVSEQSSGVKMSFTNSVLDKDNTDLEILLTADKYYNYGEPYEVEVLLDGKWYGAPFAGGVFNMPMYSVGPDAENIRAVCSCDPVFRCGILPAGQYRIVKEFDLPDPDRTAEGLYVCLAKETVTAEFTVKETLGSEDAYIDAMSEVENE